MNHTGQSIATKDFSIFVAPETFERSGSTAVVGVIHVKAGDEMFPDNVWYDFPVTVVGWWLSAVAKLVDGTYKTAPCDFMDGPYRFDITPNANGLWHLIFLRRGAEKTHYLFECVAEPKVVIESLLSAARTVIETSRSKGMTSSDLDFLTESYAKLNSLHNLPTPVAA